MQSSLYQPPLNVLAVIILLPLKIIVSPRWFHKVNVTAVRVTNLPILLAIAWYDRNYLWKQAKPKAFQQPKVHSFWDFSRFSVHGDIQAVFDTDPPEYIYDEVSDVEDSNEGRQRIQPTSQGNGKQNGDAEFRAPRLHKESTASMVGLTEQLSHMLQKHDGSSINERLEILEASTGRIELLLRKLYEDGGGDDRKSPALLVEESDDQEPSDHGPLFREISYREEPTQ